MKELKPLKVGQHMCRVIKMPDPVFRGNADYEMIAPDGKIFGGNGTHSILAPSIDAIKAQAARERIVDCDDPNCDVCNS
jgi:hypothetical protein